MKYIIEITTNDNRETLLKREEAESWKEANDIIDDMQDFTLDNIKIDLYKQKLKTRKGRGVNATLLFFVQIFTSLDTKTSISNEFILNSLQSE